MIYIKDMDMPVDCLGCRISCKHESYMVIGRPEDCPLEEAKDGDLISRADAIEAVIALRHKAELSDYNFALGLAEDAIRHLPSADATCATCADRALCIMSAPDGNWKACKDYRPSAEAVRLDESCDDCPLYDHDKHNCPRFNKVIPETIAEAVREWIPCSERLPDVDVEVLTTTDWSEVLIAWYRKDGTWETDEYILESDEILAWMPLPTPYKGGDSE